MRVYQAHTLKKRRNPGGEVDEIAVCRRARAKTSLGEVFSPPLGAAAD
jgi:hypothetical protein